MRAHGFGLVISHKRLYIASSSRLLWLPDRVASVIARLGNRILCRISGHVWRRGIQVAFPYARYSGELICDACSRRRPDPEGYGEWVHARPGVRLGQFSWPLVTP